MAGTSGFFLQGLSSGFAQGQQIQEMNWQRKEKERIKKEEDALLETLTMAGKKFSSYYTDYNVSEEERLEAIATWSALSYEAKDLLKGAYDGVMNYNKETEEQSLATVKAYREQLEGLDFDLSTISEISGMFRGQIKSPNGLKYFDAMDSMIRKNKEAQQKQPQIERFTSPEGVIAKYPDATPEHTTQGWIPKFATDKEGTPLSAKDNWAIDNYKSGKLNFDQLSNYMGTRITPEKATALEDEIAKAKQYGATNEEIKGMIVGGTGIDTTTAPETVSTLKSWETMFDIGNEEGPKSEEDYNRALDLLSQSEDKYKPKYPTWKEALIAEAKGIGKELEGITDKEDYNLLLNIYMQKLEEIKAKYPEVNLDQFKEFKDKRTWFDKLKEKVGL